MDIYTLGCVGYWLLTGRLVFQAPNAIQLMYQHANTPPVPPSQRSEMEIPPELDRVILACLAKHPEDRPQTAAELSRRLLDLGSGCLDARSRRIAGGTGTIPSPPGCEPTESEQADADQDHGSGVGAGGDTRVRRLARERRERQGDRGGSR